MNRLEVYPYVEEFGYAQGEWPEMAFALRVDGELPAWLRPHEDAVMVISPAPIARSVLEDGEIFIVTCACGHAEDAGLTAGIRVSRDEQSVRWQADYPPVDWLFDPAQYATAVAAGIAEGRRLANTRKLNHWRLPD